MSQHIGRWRTYSVSGRTEITNALPDNNRNDAPPNWSMGDGTGKGGERQTDRCRISSPLQFAGTGPTILGWLAGAGKGVVLTESRLAQRALLEETVSLLDLAKRRCRASRVSDPDLKSLVGSVLDAAAQEILHLMETVGDAPQQREPAGEGVPERGPGNESRTRRRRTISVPRRVNEDTEASARHGG